MNHNVEEKELLNQFANLIDKIDIDEIGIKEKIKNEVERFKKFQKNILGIKGKVVVDDIDIRNYAKYILRDGTDIEKRELLSCLKSKIILQEKNIKIKKDRSLA